MILASYRYLFGTFLFFSVFLLNTQNSYAQTYRMNANYFVRSSLDFLSEKNKIGVLTEGSTFRVVGSAPQRNSAEALEIEVLELKSESYVKPSPTGRIYIYKSNKNHFTQLTSGTAKTEQSTTEGQAALIGCKNCGTTASQNEIPSTTENRDNLGDIATKVVEESNQAPSPEKNLEGKAGSLDEKIKNYSDSEEVKKMIAWAMKNKRSHSIGKCYRAVKEALAYKCGPNIYNKKGKLTYSCHNPFAPKGGRWGEGHNLIPEVPTNAGDQSALSAKDRLKDFGFVNLLETEPYKSEITSPSKAPKGAVLVYSSGIPCRGTKIRDCGHIEIKTDDAGKPGYVSDYYSKDPINETDGAKKIGTRYKLVGVMIKPKD